MKGTLSSAADGSQGRDKVSRSSLLLILDIGSWILDFMKRTGHDKIQFIYKWAKFQDEL